MVVFQEERCGCPTDLNDGESASKLGMLLAMA
jgi:hypothetical protein